jgi:thiamine biosynthesis lipoprotein
MGMPIILAMRGRHAADDRGQAAWQEVQAILRDVDSIFSTYRSDSVISRLNHGKMRLADCPAEVGEVFELGELARQQSGGAFNIRRRGPEGRVDIDPSGVVKGWAVDRAARVLDELPATDFCLSAGGDMVCRTKVTAAPPWRIGIEDPRDPGRICAVVPVSHGAVATSGPAHRGHHIVDARTGSTPVELASVTVISSDLVWADIDATAAFALGADGIAWLNGRHGRSGLVVWADGTTELFGTDSESGVSRPAW